MYSSVISNTIYYLHHIAHRYESHAYIQEKRTFRGKRLLQHTISDQDKSVWILREREFKLLNIFSEDLISDIFTGIDRYISTNLRMNIKNITLCMIKGFRSVCDPLRPVNLHLLRGKSTVSGVDSERSVSFLHVFWSNCCLSKHDLKLRNDRMISPRWMSLFVVIKWIIVTYMS